MFSFSVLDYESPSSDDFSESSCDDFWDFSVKKNGGAKRKREREQVEGEGLYEAMGQKQSLGAEGDICLNMQQEDQYRPYVDMAQDLQHLDMEQELYEDIEQQLYVDMEREQYEDVRDEQYVGMGDKQYEDMGSEQYEDMGGEQYEDMGNEQYQQMPPGILNFGMCTALPKHNTRNITSIVLQFFAIIISMQS